MKWGFWRDRDNHEPTDWEDVFIRAMQRHPSWTFNDIGKLTWPQLIHALGINVNEVRPTTTADLFAMFDSIALELGASPQGLMELGLSAINAQVEKRMVGWPGEWYLRGTLPAWIQNRST